jgi:hypothetical protein
MPTWLANPNDLTLSEQGTFSKCELNGRRFQLLAVKNQPSKISWFYIQVSIPKYKNKKQVLRFK